MSELIGELYYILNTDKTATVTFSTARGGDPDNYPNLIDITIPETIKDNTYTVTSIGDDAFYNSKIKSIVIPASITSIGDDAFYNSKIKSIVIPASVTSIGNSAFELSNLKSIVFEGSKPDFGEYVFYGIGNKLNPSFGYINNPDDSWKGTNYIDDLIIRNTSSYSKSIISIIICLILLFMIYTSNISVGYKYSLYIIIIISSLFLNTQFNTNFLFNKYEVAYVEKDDDEDKTNRIVSIFKIFKIIIILLPFLLYFIVLIPIYPLLKILLFGFFGLIYFIDVLILTFPDLLYILD
jgi:hypothetical protein